MRQQRGGAPAGAGVRTPRQGGGRGTPRVRGSAFHLHSHLQSPDAAGLVRRVSSRRAAHSEAVASAASRRPRRLRAGSGIGGGGGRDAAAPGFSSPLRVDTGARSAASATARSGGGGGAGRAMGGPDMLTVDAPPGDVYAVMGTVHVTPPRELPVPYGLNVLAGRTPAPPSPAMGDRSRAQGTAPPSVPPGTSPPRPQVTTESLNAAAARLQQRYSAAAAAAARAVAAVSASPFAQHELLPRRGARSGTRSAARRSGSADGGGGGAASAGGGAAAGSATRRKLLRDVEALDERLEREREAEERAVESMRAVAASRVRKQRKERSPRQPRKSPRRSPPGAGARTPGQDRATGAQSSPRRRAEQHGEPPEIQVAMLQREVADSQRREAETRARAAQSAEVYEGRLVVLQSQVDDLLAESVQIRADAELLANAQVVGQRTVQRERALMAQQAAEARAAAQEEARASVADTIAEAESLRAALSKAEAALTAAKRNHRTKEALAAAEAKATAARVRELEEELRQAAVEKKRALSQAAAAKRQAARIKQLEATVRSARARGTRARGPPHSPRSPSHGTPHTTGGAQQSPVTPRGTPQPPSSAGHGLSPSGRESVPRMSPATQQVSPLAALAAVSLRSAGIPTGVGAAADAGGSGGRPDASGSARPPSPHWDMSALEMLSSLAAPDLSPAPAAAGSLGPDLGDEWDGRAPGDDGVGTSVDPAARRGGAMMTGGLAADAASDEVFRAREAEAAALARAQQLEGALDAVGLDAGSLTARCQQLEAQLALLGMARHDHVAVHPDDAPDAFAHGATGMGPRLAFLKMRFHALQQAYIDQLAALRGLERAAAQPCASCGAAQRVPPVHVGVDGVGGSPAPGAGAAAGMAKEGAEASAGHGDGLSALASAAQAATPHESDDGSASGHGNVDFQAPSRTHAPVETTAAPAVGSEWPRVTSRALAVLARSRRKQLLASAMQAWAADDGHDGARDDDRDAAQAPPKREHPPSE